MGVPAFFKWLRRRFPKSVWDAAESEDARGAAEPGDVDWTGANPSGFEVDCLYLDMNGVIHACTHPQDRPAPPDQPAMMREICAYVDKLATIARPRRLLVLAIDGVAPRAKMNQQRARRFLAAKEAGLRSSARRKAADEWRALGLPVPEGSGSAAFDHTVITPGTEFMAAVSHALRAHVCARVASHPAWRALTVVLSDASEPGEGEHKIMEYVRTARASAGYDSTQTHVVYGLDADLVLLGLASHEPRWALLREWVPTEKERERASCSICGRAGHGPAACPLGALRAPGASSERVAPLVAHRPFLWLSLWVLREYLEHALRPSAARLPPARADAGAADDAARAPGARARAEPARAPFSLDAALDDLVALSFLAGNDFLPHLPGLEVHSGGMDELLRALGRARAQAAADVADARRSRDEQRRVKAEAAGGPLLVRGELQRAALCAVVEQLAGAEERLLERAAQRASRADAARGAGAARGRAADARPLAPNAAEALGAAAFDERVHGELEALLRAEANADDALAAAPDAGSADDAHGGAGARARAAWYASSLGARFAAQPGAVRALSLAYVRGLAWVSGYYYVGVPSWAWHFAYHYAPFAADIAHALRELSDEAFGALAGAASFELGVPFAPLAQLMAVLPPASAHCVPRAYQPLLSAADSPLAAWYPRTLSLDLRGCTQLWQGVARLPFIDADRLLAELDAVRTELLPTELARNAHQPAVVIASASSALAALAAEALHGARARGARGVPVGFELGLPIVGELRACAQSSPPGAIVLTLALPALPRERLAFGALPGASAPARVLTLDDVAGCVEETPRWAAGTVGDGRGTVTLAGAARGSGAGGKRRRRDGARGGARGAAAAGGAAQAQRTAQRRVSSPLVGGVVGGGGALFGFSLG
ncbi:hypothetical protein KFE25_000413 [Diacronema lutheri]|uniref:5'-3' exoribonuclease n=1 Tax=Diacronema lutheri TaxID=2081491 RepID=A0A8J5XR38_DIALT|nr:hypothetical protein KFE25_000413 [Diacronema lutheri]